MVADTIQSPLLGTMTRQEINRESWWLSGQIAVPMMDGEPLRVIIQADLVQGRESIPGEYERAMKKFLTSGITKDRLAEILCGFFLRDYPHEGSLWVDEWRKIARALEGKPHKEVWKHVQATGIRVMRLADMISIELRFVSDGPMLEVAFADAEGIYSEGIFYAGETLPADELRLKLLPDSNSRILGPLNVSQESDLGTLRRDSRPIELPLFAGRDPMPFRVIWNGSGPLPESAEKALAAFMAIDTMKYSQAIYAQCMEYFEAVGFDGGTEEQYREGLAWKEGDMDFWDYNAQKWRELYRLKDKNDVWNYMWPQEYVYMKQDQKTGDWYIQLSCGCHWESEHGITLTFINGERLVFDHDEIY